MERAVFIERRAFVGRRQRPGSHGARHLDDDGLTGPIGALAEVVNLELHAIYGG